MSVSWSGGRRLVMAPSRICLTLAVLTLICASCGSSGEGDVLRSGSHYVIVGADGDLDNVAGFGLPSSRVELVGDCLGIDGRTVIWPHGTKIVSSDPLLEIDVPGFGTLSEGDELEEAGAETGQRTNCQTALTPYHPAVPAKT